MPELPNSLRHIDYSNTPIYDYIKKYFNNNWKQYNEFQHKINKKIHRSFANKIGEWYLECKYNPEYLACRKRLKLEYRELYKEH